MISNIKKKPPLESSLAKTAVSLGGGIGSMAPHLAGRFEAHLSEIIANSGELLRVVIQNKIAAVKPAHRRNKRWFFHKLHRIFKIDAENIELSGVELFAAVKLLKEQVDVEIFPGHTYHIPFCEAERILDRLNSVEHSC